MTQETKTQWKIAIFSAIIAIIVGLMPYIGNFVVNQTTPDYAVCTEAFNESTTWTSGGGHDAYCPAIKQRAIQARGLGEKGVAAKATAAGEEARWGNPTLRTNRQYKYTCRIELQWRTILTDDVNPDICTPEEKVSARITLLNFIIAFVSFFIILIIWILRQRKKPI